MIMTHMEEGSTTFQSKTATEQMNGHSMATSDSREPEEQSCSTTSPSEGRHADGSSGSSVLGMGSTDSAGSAHSGGPSCGLVSSLFPSGCRGRAESFARRLHRRLTSLGGEENSTECKTDPTGPKETSWLRGSSGTKAIANNVSNHVHQRQPRHNPETDIYNDFVIDLDDGLGSPAEEASDAELADLLVNPGVSKTKHRNGHDGTSNGTRAPALSDQDSEPSFVFASPITGTSPDSDSMDMYFDPESSESENPKNEVYFDPMTTSDSEATPNLSNGCIATKGKSLPSRRRLGNNVERPEDSSDSSCSSRQNNCRENKRRDDVICSSEESSNGRSSLEETTSASHESLWSTFDESTVSLQDETPSKISSAVSTIQTRLPKSHSDSEIPVNGSRTLICCALPRRDEETETDIDEVDFVNGLVESSNLENIRNARNRGKEPSPDSSENTEDELPLDEEISKRSNALLSNCEPDSKVEETITPDTDTDRATYISAINLPGTLTVECATGQTVTERVTNSEPEMQMKNESVNEEKMCQLLKKLAIDSAPEDETSTPTRVTQKDCMEEEEEEEERPQKVRRCSSLKTGKTPPGTPGRKKIVRFADVLGLDLADVRTFLDEVPKIPNSAYCDLIYDDIIRKDSSPVNSLSTTWDKRYLGSRRGSDCPLNRKPDRTLVPLFQQPGGLPNFLDLVRERRVCLENVLVQDPLTLCIQGTVRVINLDFHKSVHIRYTLDSWRNFSDLQATYVSNSCDGLSDKFSFVLYCHTLPVGQRLEFAVRFHCKGTQYWDNNGGANYCFQCLPTSSMVNYIPITAPESRQHEWSPIFY